jgi:hypothetical protein
MESATLMMRDVIFELAEELREKESREKAKNGDKYEAGRRFGIYEALSLITSKADGFGISFEGLGIDDINPDKLL